MRNTRVLSVILCLMIVMPRFGQGQSCLNQWGGWELRQDIDTKANVAKDAVAQAQIPTRSQDPKTILVNVGLLVPLCATSKWELDVTTDYHRNTDSKSPQNAGRLGLTFLITASHGIVQPYISVDALFKRDWLSRTTSVESAILASVTGKGGHSLPNTYIHFGSAKQFAFVYTPYLGLEVERNVAGDTLNQRFVRFVGRMDLDLLVGKDPSQPDWELAVDNAFRHEFKDRPIVGSDYSSNSISAIAYFGGQSSKRFHAGVSLSYVYGTDPTQGLVKASYIVFGLTFRVKSVS